MTSARAARSSITTPVHGHSAILWPNIFELYYFALVFYAIMGPAIGVNVPLLGAGALLLLAMACVWRSLDSGVSWVRALRFPLGCAATFIAIQVVIHGESFFAAENRYFVTWSLSLIVAYLLAARRGFLLRFGFASLFIAASFLPFITTQGIFGGASTDRIGLDGAVGLANPNDLAAWFGFGCVFLSILALHDTNRVLRGGFALLSLACLYVAGLTVSRGTLAAIAIAVLCALYFRLRKGLAPIVLLGLVAGGVVYSGIFDTQIDLYVERGGEETGRLQVWPMVFDRIGSAPVAGVGISNLETWVPAANKARTPHNGFLEIALAAGLIPMSFYMLYWLRVIWEAWRKRHSTSAEDVLYLPLVLYAFVVAFFSSNAFMFPWAVVVCACALPRTSSPQRIVRLRQLRQGRIAPLDSRVNQLAPRRAVRLVRISRH